MLMREFSKFRLGIGAERSLPVSPCAPSDVLRLKRCGWIGSNAGVLLLFEWTPGQYCTNPSRSSPVQEQMCGLTPYFIPSLERAPRFGGEMTSNHRGEPSPSKEKKG